LTASVLSLQLEALSLDSAPARIGQEPEREILEKKTQA
jgi:hypothetical protein